MKKTYLTLICCLIISLTQAQDIVNIPDPVWKNILLSAADTNNDGEIQVTEAEGYTYCLGAGLSNPNSGDINNFTGIEAFVNIMGFCFEGYNTNVTELDLSNNNQITQIIIYGLAGLETLITGQNNALERIEIGSTYNNLANIDVTQNLALKELIVYHSQIANIDLSQNQQLEFLLLMHYETNSQGLLTNLDLSQNANLTEIYISGNQINDLVLPNGASIGTFEVNNNKLTTLDLSPLHQLGNTGPDPGLDCSNNLINEVIFGNLTFTNGGGGGINFFNNQLQTLDLSTTNFSNAPLILSNNFHLEYINLKNGVSESYATLDAYSCPNLEAICVDNPNSPVFDVNYDPSQYVALIEDCITDGDEYNQVFGTVNFDLNNTGCTVDASGMQGLNMEVSNVNEVLEAITYNNGFYNQPVLEGSYTITPTNLPSYFDVSPTSQDVTFVGYNNTETVNFCVTANQTVNDVNVIILPIREARPGFDTEYKLIYKNVGTTTQSGSVSFQFDDNLQTLVSSNPAADTSTNNNLTYNYTNLQPFESREVFIKLNIFPPTTVNGGDSLPLSASITPTANDATLEDNTFEYNHFVVNSYDPNDKQVLQGSEIFEDETDNYLDYLIRFQNTGTASAINVSVADELDAKLDWNTFQMVSASHPYEVNITNGNFVQFIFDDIFLPAEQDDEPASHGYIAFKIKPKADVIIGDIINGQASIYFDFNAPIITNEVSTEVVAPLSVLENSLDSSLRIYPNPTNNQFRIKTSDNINIERVSMFSITGEQLFETSNVSESYDLSGYASGVYFVKVETDKGSIHKRIIKN